MSNAYDIGGNFTRFGINEISTTEDNSIDVSENGDISQHTKNYAEQFYSPAVFGQINGALSTNLVLPDNTTMKVVETKHSFDPGNEPGVTLECTSLNSNIPQVTVYWTATALKPDTVFATAGLSITTPNPTLTSFWLPRGGAIYDMAFDLQSNYTKAYVGGDFTDLGSKGAPLSHFHYGVVNLSGGQVHTRTGSSGKIETFGPVGSALSGLNINTNFYGGYGGIRINGTVTSVLNVSVGAANYLFIGGSLLSVNVGTSTCRLTAGDSDYTDVFSRIDDFPVRATVLAFDLNSTRDNFAAISLQDYQLSAKKTGGSYVFDPVYLPNPTVTCLEYDPDNNSLLIGSNVWGRRLGLRDPLNPDSNKRNGDPRFKNLPTGLVTRILLSATAPNSSRVKDRLSADWQFCRNVVTHSLGNYWDYYNFYPDQVKIFEGINTANVRTLKYFKNVVYVGGRIFQARHASASPIIGSGMAALVCSQKGFIDNGTSYTKQVGQEDWVRYTAFKGTQPRWHVVNSIAIDYSPYGYENAKPDKLTMYIGGHFNAIHKYTPTTPGGLTETTSISATPFICALDLRPCLSAYPGDTMSSPKLLTNWAPVPDNYVRNIVVEDSTVYAIGAFANVTASNGKYARLQCVALSEADTTERVGEEALRATVRQDWKADISGTSLDGDKLYIIPNTSPLSGLMVLFKGMTKINNVATSSIARVTKYGQNISDLNSSYVDWSMGCGNMSNGSLLIDVSNISQKSDLAERPYVLNTLTFSPADLSAGLGGQINKGDLMRFFLQRDSRAQELTGFLDSRKLPYSEFGFETQGRAADSSLYAYISSCAVYFETAENKITAFHWSSAGSSNVKALTSYVANNLQSPLTGTVVNLAVISGLGGEIKVPDQYNNADGVVVIMRNQLGSYIKKELNMSWSTGSNTVAYPHGSYFRAIQSTYRYSARIADRISATNAFTVVDVRQQTGNTTEPRQMSYLGKAWIVGAKVEQNY